MPLTSAVLSAYALPPTIVVSDVPSTEIPVVVNAMILLRMVGLALFSTTIPGRADPSVPPTMVLFTTRAKGTIPVDVTPVVSSPEIRNCPASLFAKILLVTTTPGANCSGFPAPRLRAAPGCGKSPANGTLASVLVPA